MSALAAVWGLLGRIPREAYIIAAAMAALWMWGNHREAEGRADERAKIDNAAMQQFIADAQALADMSRQLEATTQSIRAYEQRDRETIREIYRNVEVPADCAVPDAAVRVLSQAVTRANSAASGKPSSEVP